METILRSRNEKLRRYAVFFIGLFIMSFGVSLVTRSLLGTSAGSNVGKNVLRRDHYSYFTEKTWGDPRNYAAVYDTSRITPDAVVASVIALYRK